MKYYFVIFAFLVLHTCVIICQSKPYYKWKQFDGEHKLFIDNMTKVKVVKTNKKISLI